MIGMLRLILLAAASAAAAVAVPAGLAASVPPVGWKGTSWTGPGHLCRGSFTLRLKEGERAEQQYPSVGLIRFVVASDAGTFEVAEDWMSGRVYEDREPVRHGPNGSVFRLTGRNDGRTYLFVPAEPRLPFLLRLDPLAGRPASFAGKGEEEEVLDRLGFTAGTPETCLTEEKPA